MLLEKIRKALLEDLHLDFSVRRDGNDILVFQGSGAHDSFYLRVTANEADRLTIICEPDRYGAPFVETLNASTMEQREKFCRYWEQLGALGAGMVISLNERSVKRDEFCSLDETWSKIRIRFTKIPYYNPETEDRDARIIEWIELVCEMILSLCTVEYEGNREGSQKLVQSVEYERDPVNRRLCILLKGCRCAVCGFDFEKVYGEIGRNFIEVHHIIPVSEMGEGYRVNPAEDLVPLCSNCHSMIHRRKPPYSPEEVKTMIIMQKRKG